MDEKEEKVWTDVRFGKLEINPGPNDFTVNIAANQIVTIDKMYGPLCSNNVRVFLEYKDDKSDWVFESYNMKTEKWEEKARFDCQENWPESEE